LSREGRLNKCIRASGILNEQYALITTVLEVLEEAKADIFAEMNKCPVLYANLSDAIER